MKGSRNLEMRYDERLFDTDFDEGEMLAAGKTQSDDKD